MREMIVVRKNHAVTNVVTVREKPVVEESIAVKTVVMMPAIIVVKEKNAVTNVVTVREKPVVVEKTVVPRMRRV